jgi:hypothetical protein
MFLLRVCSDISVLSACVCVRACVCGQGGSVKGRMIHGLYPEDINPATSELEVGRGRGVFIPTTPWVS